MSGAAQPHTQLTRAEATTILPVGGEYRGDRHHRRDGDTDPPRGDRRINAASPNTLPVICSTGASSPSPPIGGYYKFVI